MRDFYYVDTGGILSYPDGRVMTPKDAAGKINRLVRENTRYKDRLQIDPGGSDKIDELQQSNDFLRHRAETAEQQIEEWKYVSGLECGGDPDGVTPAKAKEFLDAEAKRIEAFQAQDIERQTDITALRHDLEVAEAEIQEAIGLLGVGGDGTLKGCVESMLCELHEYKSRSQSIPNPPEATGEYGGLMNEFPEHVRLSKIKDLSQPVGEFLEWLKGRGIHLFRYEDAVYSDEGRLLTRIDGKTAQHIVPVHASTCELLADFFEIDLLKLEEERWS